MFQPVAPSVDEAAIDRFEAAWLAGQPRPIEEFLLDEADSRFARTIEELACVEMECAWKAWAQRPSEESRPCGVEQYASRFPMLGRPEALARLAQQEYRVRHGAGDRPTPAEYVRRFGESARTWQFDCATETKSQESATATGPLAPHGAAPTGAASRECRYELVAEQGRGGFGCVWRATDPVLGREVALKQLDGRLAAHEELRQRFVAEARVTARLEHPGIVPVYDLGHLAENAPYYTMKLVRGRTLAVAIRDYHQQAKGTDRAGLEQAKLLGAFLNVTRAMEFAHSRGVLHRDLKPQNIVLGDFGETIILDWGLAKCTTAAEASANEVRSPDGPKRDVGIEATQPGDIKGTPAYMSPEQAAGRVDEIDERSDVYGLGAILYQLLTSRLPYEGRSSEAVLRQVLNETPPPPRLIEPSVPRALEAVCLKAMAHRREERYATARKLSADVERFLADEPVAARADTWPELAARWMRRHRSWTLAGAVALIIVGAAGSTSALLIDNARRAAESARGEESLARRGEAQARADEHAQRLEAESRLIRLYVKNGQRHIERHDWLAALPWYTAALKLAGNRPEEHVTHRQRVGMLLARCPKLEQALFHDEDVHSVAIVDGGKRLHVLGDHGVWVWDLATGQLVRRLDFGKQIMIPPKLSPDGAFATVNDRSKPEIRVYRVATGEIVAQLGPPQTNGAKKPFHWTGDSSFSADSRTVVTQWSQGLSTIGGQVVNTVNGSVRILTLKQLALHLASLSADGLRIATGTWDTGVWEVATGKQLAKLSHDELLTAISISRGGQLVATGTRQGIHVWSVATGQRLYEPLVHESGPAASLQRLVFSADGSRLASVGLGFSVKTWDVRTGRLLATHAHQGGVRHVRFADDGKLILTASDDGTARLWRTDDGTPLLTFLRHAGPVRDAVRHSHLVVTVGEDRTVRVWNLLISAGNERAFLTVGKPGVYNAAYSSDGSLVATARLASKDAPQDVRFWDARTGHPRGPTIEVPGGLLTKLQFSPDGAKLLAENNTDSGKGVYQVSVWNVHNGTPCCPPLVHRGLPVTVATFSQDSRRVLSANSGTARIWDLERGEVLHTLVHSGGVNDAAWSPDGELVATASHDKSVAVWSAATGQRVAMPLDHPLPVTAVAWSADGQRIISTCGHSIDDGELRVWNASDFKLVCPAIKHRSLVRSAFGPDGRTFFAVEEANVARLLDALTGEPLGEPLRHAGKIHVVRYSPDGSRLLTGGEDKTARVWDTATGKPLSPRVELGAEVSRAAFSSDGRLVATASSLSSEAHLWDARFGELLAPPLQHQALYHGLGAGNLAFHPHAPQLLTTHDLGVYLWNLRPVDQSVEELSEQAELLAGHRVDELGSLIPLTTDELRRRWEQRVGRASEGTPTTVSP